MAVYDSQSFQRAQCINPTYATEVWRRLCSVWDDGSETGVSLADWGAAALADRQESWWWELHNLWVCLVEKGCLYRRQKVHACDAVKGCLCLHVLKVCIVSHISSCYDKTSRPTWWSVFDRVPWPITDYSSCRSSAVVLVLVVVVDVIAVVVVVVVEKDQIGYQPKIWFQRRNVQTFRWHKLRCNVMGNSICAGLLSLTEIII